MKQEVMKRERGASCLYGRQGGLGFGVWVAGVDQYVDWKEKKCEVAEY